MRDRRSRLYRGHSSDKGKRREACAQRAEHKGRGRVAGNDDKIRRKRGDKLVDDGDHPFDERALSEGAIGKTRRIRDIKKLVALTRLGDFVVHGQSAKTGIEDQNLQIAPPRGQLQRIGTTSAPLPATIRPASPAASSVPLLMATSAPVRKRSISDAAITEWGASGVTPATVLASPADRATMATRAPLRSKIGLPAAFCGSEARRSGRASSFVWASGEIVATSSTGFCVASAAGTGPLD